MKNLLPLAALAVICTGCAQSAEEPRTIVGIDTERQCFFTRQINGYADAPDGPDGEQRIYITTGVNDRWLFETRGSCSELDFALQIGLDTRGTSSVCTGDIETLLVPSTFSERADRCPVRMLGKVIEE